MHPTPFPSKIRNVDAATHSDRIADMLTAIADYVAQNPRPVALDRADANYVARQQYNTARRLAAQTAQTAKAIADALTQADANSARIIAQTR